MARGGGTVASDPSAVLAAIKAELYEARGVDLVDFNTITLLADALQAVLDLVAEWDQYAGPGSEAERVFGKQVVSVPFAVDKVRETITTALAKGETS